MTEQPKDCGECLQHNVLALKVAQLCMWRSEHEKEFRTMEKEIDKKFDGFKTLVITNLIVLVFLLTGTIINLIKG